MPSTTSPDSWQSLVERALAGDAVDDVMLITRAAAASGALGDAKLLQFVQLGLVQALAKKNKLDKTAAAQLLAKIGASPSAQIELAKGTKNATAACFALTSAVAEVVQVALADDTAPALADLFGAAYERALGTTTTKLAKGTPAHAKLAQVQDAFDADLINEAEALALKERVLASIF
jgi:hypothetical protein